MKDVANSYLTGTCGFSMNQHFHPIQGLQHVPEGDPGFVHGEEQDRDTAMRAAQALLWFCVQRLQVFNFKLSAQSHTINCDNM